MKKVISPFSQGLMAPKLSKAVTQDEGTTPTKSLGHERYISTFTRSMVLKLSRVVTKNEWTHPQSHMTLASFGPVKNQKYFFFTFKKCKAHKLSRVVNRRRRSHPTCHVTI